MITWLKESWFKIIISISIILLVTVISYYLLSVKPEAETKKLNTQLQIQEITQEQEIKQLSNLNDCLTQAEIEKSTLINNFTKNPYSLDDKLINAESMLNIIDKTYKQERGECFLKYPQ